MNTRTSPVDTPRTDLVARLREPSFRHCNCETCKFIDEAASVLERQARRIAVLEGALRELAMREELYRAAHDLHGDDSRESGYAWDQMRSAGNKARAALEETP